MPLLLLVAVASFYIYFFRGYGFAPTPEPKPLRSEASVSPTPASTNTPTQPIMRIVDYEPKPSVVIDSPPALAPSGVDTFVGRDFLEAPSEATSPSVVSLGVDPLYSYDYELEISSYYPVSDDYCLDWQAGACLSLMATGHDWRVWDGKALACPVALLGYSFYIEGLGEFPCLDYSTQLTCVYSACRVYLLDSSWRMSWNYRRAALLIVPAVVKH